MSPGTSAAVSGAAVVLLGYFIFFASEGPSPTLAFLQYALFAIALVGLVGSLFKLNRRQP